MRCSACGTEDVDKTHSCIEAKHLLHVTYWGVERLEAMGHDLGYYTRRLHKNIKLVTSYSDAVALDLNSKERAEIHKKVCELIGADHNKFKPFDSDSIWNLPTKEQAKVILWNAILEHLWTYTTLYLETGKTYRTVYGYREKYIGKHQDLVNVFESN